MLARQVNSIVLLGKDLCCILNEKFEERHGHDQNYRTAGTLNVRVATLSLHIPHEKQCERLHFARSKLDEASKLPVKDGFHFVSIINVG